MNVTFDTNVLLSATLWDGSVSQKLVFGFIRRGDIIMYSSPKILDEYQTVLKRDFDFSDDDVTEAIQKVLSFVTLITPTIRVDIVKNDPKDNAIVECALASKSKYIISYDNHLLDIKEHQGIRMIRPEEARAIL